MLKEYWLISSFNLQETEGFINTKAKEGWKVRQFSIVPGREANPYTEYVALMERDISNSQS